LAIAIPYKTGTRYRSFRFHQPPIYAALITENRMTYAKPLNIKHLQLFFKNFQKFCKFYLNFSVFRCIFYNKIPELMPDVLSVPIAKGDGKVGMKRVD
jgi:hypothetical protein